MKCSTCQTVIPMDKDFMAHTSTANGDVRYERVWCLSCHEQAINTKALLQAVRVLLEIELSHRATEPIVRVFPDGKVYEMEHNGNEFYWKEVANLKVLSAQLSAQIESVSP